MRYDEFVRAVRGYRAVALLRLLARASIQQWHRRPLRLVDVNDPIKPWSISLAAREALAGGLHAAGRERPTPEVLRRLDELVFELEDPLMSNHPAGPGLDDVTGWMLRTGYQQFPYQQPIFGETARMRPMLTRSFPRPRYQVLSDAVIAELLGTDISTYVDLSPFFLAAVMVNNGTFDPAWLDQPNFTPILDGAPKEEILRVYHTRLSAPFAALRDAAKDKKARHERPELRQHDFNPLINTPFIILPDGIGLAPQPSFVTGRFSMSALYYAGMDTYGKPFADDLGLVNEEYVLEQLSLLQGDEVSVRGEITYTEGGNTKQSVDGFVVHPDQVLFVEVKSQRPVLTKRLDPSSYTAMLQRDIDKARKQLQNTHQLWKGQHPAFAGLPADDRAVRGLIVVPEPLYLANHTMFNQFTMPFPTAIVSLTQLELAVSIAAQEKSSRVFTDLTAGSQYLVADVEKALSDARKRAGVTLPRNSILDDSFARMRWRARES
ncbi:hypothetical protein GCM10029963_73640 [Micromonospora andamanensis]|uniref:hypothetical protein n=1 Tax=Micromonospora andamanensis TaxID=1287068 RepID=UPI0019525809|nr:hypothetical protein [Micromonospora andamanensis]GIJ42695.1 hypothetical protein Vwe01_60200 [Micromonospora andamanensis]